MHAFARRALSVRCPFCSSVLWPCWYARNKKNMNSPEKKCQFQFCRYGASPVCILLGDVVNDVAQDEIELIHGHAKVLLELVREFTQALVMHGELPLLYAELVDRVNPVSALLICYSSSVTPVCCIQNNRVQKAQTEHGRHSKRWVLKL